MNAILIMNDGKKKHIQVNGISSITSTSDGYLCVSLGEKGDIFCKIIMFESWATSQV